MLNAITVRLLLSYSHMCGKNLKVFLLLTLLTFTLHVKGQLHFNDTRSFFKLTDTSFQEGQVFVIRIYFDFNANRIMPECYPHLDSIAEFIKGNPDLTFEIGGHTDFRGSNNYNLKLSEMRARGVTEYFIGKNIDKTRLSAKGYGEDSPLVPPDTILKFETKEIQEEAHRLNRRMELKITGVKNPVPKPVTQEKSPLPVDSSDSLNKLNYKETRGFFTLSDTLFKVGQVYEFTPIIYDCSDKIFANDQLDLIAEFLNKHPELIVEFSFHTDFRGSQSYNRELSYRRAKVVYEKELVPKLLYPENVKCAGYGEDSPLIPETEILKMKDKKLQEEAHAINRRVELKILSIKD